MICCACNSTTKHTLVTNSENSWEYKATGSSLLMDNNHCSISLVASPSSHELSYVISYEGTGYLQPIQIVTIEGRSAAALISEKQWIEKDTVIQGSIYPESNLLQYVEINEKGPLRRRYQINLQEDGKMQHLAYHLDENQYKKYQKEFPYSSKKKSYQLVAFSDELKLSISNHLNKVLEEGKSRAKSIRLSEKELNVAGLICRVRSIYDGKNFSLEMTWINHTDFDLWLLQPIDELMIDHQRTKINWIGLSDRTPFGKGKRITLTTKLPVITAPQAITVPLENIAFFDGGNFFPQNMKLRLEDRNGV